MQLKPEQLATHLQQTDLAPVYFIAGDEPLQVMEAADAVRTACRNEGYEERIVIDVEANFDWGRLLQEAGNLSLFSQHRLIDLRLRHYKPGRDGAKVIAEYTASLPPDTVLLITADKQDKATKSTRWHKALDSAGVSIVIWPLKPAELPDWLVRRAQRQKCRLSLEAARLIAERIEGNLLAAAQEIDKLALLYPDEVIDIDKVLNAVSDSARYDVFALVDAALAGEGARVSRMLSGLRAEGEAAPMILWALGRELTTMCQIAWLVDTGSSVDQAMATQRVWQNRKRLVQRAVGRYALRSWQGLLRRCGRVEQVAKGRREGNAWDEIMRLALQVAGVKMVKG